MAWPFSQVPPDFDSGEVGLPASLTLVSAGTKYLMGITVANNTSGVVSLTVSDGAGNVIIPATPIAPHNEFTRAYNFRPVAGIQWAGSGLTGKVWGYGA